jgi:hypothetical protein
VQVREVRGVVGHVRAFMASLATVTMEHDVVYDELLASLEQIEAARR